MGKITTVQLMVKTKNELEKLRVSDRDTYNDIIENLIENTLELNEETKRELEEALRKVKNGEFLTHEEVKKRLGVNE